MKPSQKIDLEIRGLRATVLSLGSRGDAVTDAEKLEFETLPAAIAAKEVEYRGKVIEEDAAAAAAAAAAGRDRGGLEFTLIGGGSESETREVAELRSKSSVTSYIKAAVEMRSVDGAEAEYNSAIGLGADQFPLGLLVPEVRQTTAVDISTNPQTWLDRLFAQTAAQRLGVSFRSVGAGVASFPVTTAGATAGQLDKSGAAPAASWAIGITEMKPKRNAVSAIFSVEDVQRIGPGLEAALQRDLRSALVEGIDATIFKGDATPTAATADIVGFQTAAISEFTITQSNKVKGAQVLAALAAYIDGQHAVSPSDIRIVASVGTNVLWMTTIQAAAVENQTVAQFLRASGIDWTTRGGIDTATANGDFGAYIGLASGVEGASIAAVWESASMIRDPYSGATKGEVGIVLNTLWDFAIPRPANFKRLKYVT